MKRIFCLLLAVIISAGVTGCAETPANAGAAPQEPVSETPAAGTDDSEGVVLVESIEIVVGDGEEGASVVETAGAEENVFERVEGIFEYKGIIFKGHYEGTSFFVDTQSLNETEEGLRLMQDSYSAMIAYLYNDVDELLKYFDNEEFIKAQKEYMENFSHKETDKISELRLNHISFAVKSDEPYFLLSYIPIFTSGRGGGPFYTLLEMYLNENGDWKIKYIGPP